jgi:hypothetical protein
VYFDYNRETQGWVIRDFILGEKLEKENSQWTIQEIEKDGDLEEIPPWLNVDREAAEWRAYLTARTRAVLRLHDTPISTDRPNQSAGNKWLPLP